MTLLALALVLCVLLIVLTSTKRWRGLARGVRSAKRALATEAREEERGDHDEQGRDRSRP